MKRTEARSSENGAESWKVDEHPGGFFGGTVVVVVEFEAWSEPKALCQADLMALMTRFGNSERVANTIGASEAFVRQSVQGRKHTVR